MIRADECGASKVAMDQKNGFYDGWAGVSTLKTGDPPLICMKKKLHCLTTQPQGSSGRDVARALHILAASRSRAATSISFISISAPSRTP